MFLEDTSISVLPNEECTVGNCCINMTILYVKNEISILYICLSLSGRNQCFVSSNGFDNFNLNSVSLCLLPSVLVSTVTNTQQYLERLSHSAASEGRLFFEINESTSITVKCWQYTMLAVCYTGLTSALQS